MRIEWNLPTTWVERKGSSGVLILKLLLRYKPQRFWWVWKHFGFLFCGDIFWGVGSRVGRVLFLELLKHTRVPFILVHLSLQCIFLWGSSAMSGSSGIVLWGSVSSGFLDGKVLSSSYQICSLSDHSFLETLGIWNQRNMDEKLYNPHSTILGSMWLFTFKLIKIKENVKFSFSLGFSTSQVFKRHMGIWLSY